MSTITCRNTLAETFDKASNKHSWGEVSAVPHTRKCLTNSKVRHNGTNEWDPNFNVYQDIQFQNDYSTTQLNVMGCRGDILRVQFCPDKISERKVLVPVTVANTREHQEALAAAHTHGKKFFMTGGKHVTSDNMFKAVELIRRKAEAAEREKDKNSWVEYHARHEAALPIVDLLKNELENNVGRLKSKELEVLCVCVCSGFRLQG